MPAPNYQWRRVTDAAPFAPRDGAAGASLDGRMWFLGGWNPDDATNFPQICNSEIWSSVDGEHWESHGSAAWEGRHVSDVVVHDGQLWLIGGDASQGHYQSDVWTSRDGREWTKVRDDAPWGPRCLHYVTSYSGHLWVVGGQTLPQSVPAPDLRYGDVWRSADGADWQRVSTHQPWAPRGMITGPPAFKGRMWLVGGGTYDTPAKPDRVCHNDVWSSADGVEWTLESSSNPWLGRQFHNVEVFDDRLWILGGCGPVNGSGELENLSDVWCSEDGRTWLEVPGTPWSPRHATTTIVHQGELWLMAGSAMQPDVWALRRV